MLLAIAVLQIQIFVVNFFEKKKINLDVHILSFDSW